MQTVHTLCTRITVYTVSISSSHSAHSTHSTIYTLHTLNTVYAKKYTQYIQLVLEITLKLVIALKLKVDIREGGDTHRVQTILASIQNPPHFGDIGLLPPLILLCCRWEGALFSCPVFVCVFDCLVSATPILIYWTATPCDPPMLLVRGSYVFISCVCVYAGSIFFYYLFL